MIIVTGAKGQLGNDVICELQSRKIDCKGIDIDDLDLTKEKDVIDFFKNNSFDALIHCAAYTAVDKAEDNRELCMKINSEATKSLAMCCKENDVKMLYVSTDYVFRGNGTTPFEVDDEKGPLNVYGESKLAGEKAVMDNLKKFFIVRTSWVFGEKNTNFIATMLKLSQTHCALTVVGDQVGSPTYAKHLAKLLCDMIVTEKYGVYHATNENYCAWNELAEYTFGLTGKNVSVTAVTTEQYGAKANRPHNSRLSKKSLDENGFKRLPTWQNAVEEYISNIK